MQADRGNTAQHLSRVLHLRGHVPSTREAYVSGNTQKENRGCAPDSSMLTTKKELRQRMKTEIREGFDTDATTATQEAIGFINRMNEFRTKVMTRQPGRRLASHLNAVLELVHKPPRCPRLSERLDQLPFSTCHISGKRV